eukprot:TRINITY_DN20718_c0_g1_i1.p1 TRINITY_DN20718_c0_g1~~TRINITY_DN20718_c0_g1_i1.p1  ORF type:complete len:167 (+),score=20.82 TRINITY_DN20718_c0_g1_i1:64-564(+)
MCIRDRYMGFLPSFYKTKSWSLAYSRTRDGTSLHSLYRNLKNVRENVLVLRDSKGVIFGAFCTEAWIPSRSFFGTGETFLFTFGEKNDHIEVFHWSSKNLFFMFADFDGFGLGADPDFGLFVDKELLKGRSARCATYENAILASAFEFEISKLEIWALVDDIVRIS